MSDMLTPQEAISMMAPHIDPIFGIERIILPENTIARAPRGFVAVDESGGQFFVILIGRQYVSVTPYGAMIDAGRLLVIGEWSVLDDDVAAPKKGNGE